MEKRVFYVDSKEGSDKNSGTSTEQAWKSLDRVNQERLYPGTKVCFKCGGSWKGTLLLRGEGIKAAPIVITSYGKGEKPEIDGDGAYSAIYLQGVSHCVVENLRVCNRAQDRKVRQGICIEGKPQGITEYVTVKNCEITEVDGQNMRETDVYESMYWNGAIYATIPGRSSERDHLHHIHILNNYIHDVRTSGIRINQEEDFINDIHHTCIVVRGNLIERTGSDGIIVANSISPLIDSNRCLDAGALGVPEETRLLAGIWVCATSNALIQRNEVAGTRLFSDDGTAFDTDWGNEGTIVFQYNYTHDNEGGFWLDCSGLNYNVGFQKTILRYNISLRDGRGVTVRAQGLPAEFYGNIFAFDKPAALCVWEDGRAFLFRKNIFLFEDEPVDSWSKACLQNNIYAGAVCRRDKKALKEAGIDVKKLLEAKELEKGEWLEEKWRVLCALTAGEGNNR